MPVLRQVLAAELGRVGEVPRDLVSLLDVPVAEIKLNTGSPCDGHAALFEDWPDASAGVTRFFVLENGKAVAVAEDAGGETRFPVIDYGE